ncbi:MAG: cobalt-precorrin 5A hydrolase [Lachnospiraceae bacterium]|nr:cobalt-precorrin 5A hydrolase [Lachnospiraceae bacterium]
MKIAGISFTQAGYELLRWVRDILEKEGHEITIGIRSRYVEEHAENVLNYSARDWAKMHFEDSDALVFVGATGITVRSIAPFVRDKRQDPAVLVLDEKGKFCIPLLSGHIGGANALAILISEQLHAIPVLTTATDINQKFAIDVFAARHGMTISNMTYAKEVSASLLSGYPVGFCCDFPVDGKLPEGFVWSQKLAAREGEVTLGVNISPAYRHKMFDHCLWLIPRCIVLGIGCKKGTPKEKIEKLVWEVLKAHYLYPESIAAVATIDLKAREPGLLDFCVEQQIPLISYSAEELKKAEGTFSSSEFVEQTTGVDNVCERSAVLEGGSNLFVKKISRDGVTCACVCKDWRISFE